MPEYPDIVVYLEHLNKRLTGQKLQQIRVVNPFFIRTFEPPLNSLSERTIVNINRIGKRIVFEFDNDLFIVLHLMISGRLHWRKTGCKTSPKRDLAVMDFENGSLLITESATKKRASMHLVKSRDKLDSFNRGGLNVFESTVEAFKEAVTATNHTLKRTLTDPRILDAIGNAYSDEILHRAKLSPVKLSQKLDNEEILRLYQSIKETLLWWTNKLRDESADSFPEKVTAFHPEMAVHGRFGLPCPVCGSKVQRIRYASNETNYCPTCQTAGKLLADRSLSRLLKQDWPRTAEELEEKLKGSN